MKNSFNIVVRNLIVILVGVMTASWVYADLFSYDMNLSKVANDTEQAKNDAILEGRLIALQSVMQKLTSTKYNSIIMNKLTEEDAFGFEKSFKIKQEQFFAGRYVAEVNFTFDRDRVLSFLDDNQIPYTENQGTKYLLVLSNPAGKELPNVDLWNFYWNNYTASNFTTNIVIYNNNGKLHINNKDALAKLKTKLEVQDIFFVTIKATSVIQPKEVDSESKNNNQNNLDQEFQAPKYLYTINMKSAFNDYKLNQEVDDVAKAFMLTVQGVDDNNKNMVFARYSRKSDDLFLNIDTSDYEKRVEIEKRITNIIGVSNVFVKEIGYGYVKLHISYKDTVATLRTELAKQCIDFNLDTFYLDLYNECTI